MHAKTIKKGAKKGLGFRCVEVSKSLKSEPWAPSGAPSLQEGFPGTQKIQKSSKTSSKITQNSENLVTHNQENPEKKTWIAITITTLAVVYIFYDSIQIGNFYGDFFGLVTAFGLAAGAVIIRSAKNRNLVPSAVLGKLIVAFVAVFFVENFELVGKDVIIVPAMCILCVAIPFVLVTIAPRYITAAEVNLFFLLETILGPIWVWLVIREEPSFETIVGGLIIITTIGIHSFLALKKTQTKTT